LRVLVIEDDRELADAVAVGLRRAGLAVDVAHDGRAGLERALVHAYDVIVLDRDLPAVHGDSVCRMLVERGSRARVLMLTAAAGDLELDTATRYACRGGRPLDLRPKEFGVLELLLAARGRVVSTEELLFRVWDEQADQYTTAVKVTMSRLRRKLGDPPVIETIQQAGYRI
jgi:DNA-binding response OmpR family regulator